MLSQSFAVGVSIPILILPQRQAIRRTINRPPRLIRVQIIACAIKSSLHAIDDTRTCLPDTLTEKMKTFDQRRVVGYLIRLCQQRAVDLFVEEVGIDGPNPRQFSVLINVFQNPGLSQTALVDTQACSRS